MTVHLRNWAGNYTFSAATVERPATIDQLQEVVRQANKIKVIGSRHSFNDIADTTGVQLSLENLDRSVVIDHDKHVVTVSAGITYGELCRQLHEAGYALHNMASLPHITVAGACATATHGSGDDNGNLATGVAALELVTADGERVVLSRDQHREQFQGAVVGLGGLGVVISLSLDVAPAFSMQQEVYENLPVAQLDQHFDEIMASAYSVSLFTDWRQERVNQVWVKRRLTADTGVAVEPDFFGATSAANHLHPLASLSADSCTLQRGIAGPWHERLPHFRVDHTPASGEELQSEYFVPRRHAIAAMRAMARLHEEIGPQLLISEVRTVAADALWMSPNYQQDSVGIHCSWKKNWPAVQKVLPLIEAQLAPFQARPHWGKLFTMSPSHLQSLYPRLPDFQNLLRTLDPLGKFRNAYLDTYIFGTHG